MKDFIFHFFLFGGNERILTKKMGKSSYIISMGGPSFACPNDKQSQQSLKAGKKLSVRVHMDPPAP